MKLLGLSGSLRSGSVHGRLLDAATGMLPDGVELARHDYREVPLYDGDLPRPAAVDALNAAIAGADAVLIGCPEYNHGIPGGLKNALDWTSRPAFASVWVGKRVGLFSASPNGVGGVRAQAQLREVLHGMLAVVYPARELSFPNAGAAFVDGVLTDEAARRRLERYVHGLVVWAQGR